MEKKHSAVDLTDLAIGVLIIGIVAAIGATILLNMRDARLTDTQQVTTANETLTSVEDLNGEAFANPWVISVTSCINATGGEAITVGNYTLTVDGTNGIGTVVSTGDSVYNNTDWNCDYLRYNLSDPQYDIPNAAATGLGEYGNWFDIIVIVGVAGVILALIFLAFGNRGGGGEGGVAY